jgi:hypothetical protein
MSEETEEVRKFTNSELTTWKRCRRKWWLANFRHLRLKKEDGAGKAATLGTRVHLGLEVLYDPNDERDPLEVLVSKMEADLIEFEGQEEKVKKEGELAYIMVEGYLEWLAEEGADEGYETLGVEEAIEVPFDGIPGVSLLGKIDVRRRRIRDGALQSMDHKVVQTFNDLRMLAPMKEQQIHYDLLEYLDFLERTANAHANGTEIDDRRTDGNILNMLRKVKRTARSTPPFYDREEVRHNIQTLQSYWYRAYAEITEILEAEKLLKEGRDPRLVVYPNPTRDCTWDCPFLPICQSFDNGENVEASIERFYEMKDPLERYGLSDTLDSEGE